MALVPLFAAAAGGAADAGVLVPLAAGAGGGGVSVPLVLPRSRCRRSPFRLLGLTGYPTAGATYSIFTTVSMHQCP
jgi:hypothetical protein